MSASGPSREAPDPDALSSPTPTDSLPEDIEAHRVPILIVVGGACTLGRDRGVIRLDGPLTIGRSSEPFLGGNSWRVPDALVSRSHARILPKDGQVMITDLGSRNGTVVDGLRLSGATTLRARSRVAVGGHIAIFDRVTEAQLSAIAEELSTPLGPIATTSPRFAQRTRQMRAHAALGHDVVLRGESGAGKEVYARAIHQASGRPGAFIPVNCGDLGPALLQHHLFGSSLVGRPDSALDGPPAVERAARGTLFLDGVDEVPGELRARIVKLLLRSPLSRSEGTQGGGPRMCLVASISRPREGRADDLATVLGTHAIEIPPLRQRREDIAGLCGQLLGERSTRSLTSQTFQILCLYYTWPGNTRELGKTLERAWAVAEFEGAAQIGVAHLPPELIAGTPFAGPIDQLSAHSELGLPDDPPGGTAAAAPLARRSPRERISRSELEALLAIHRGRVADIARRLDRRWEVVHRWIKQYGLDPSRFRDRDPPL